MTILANLIDTLKISGANLDSIKCAKFGYVVVDESGETDEYGDYPSNDIDFVLPMGYTQEQRQSFIDSMDLEYDAFSYQGGLEGTVWFEDGSWCTIELDYDWCSSYWTYFKCPPIPDELMQTG